VIGSQFILKVKKQMNFFNRDINADTKELDIEGDQFHHFKNVGRGRIGDSGKIFNGDGLIAKFEVSALEKRRARLAIGKVDLLARSEGKKLILGVPKKEYFESILKSCIQIGINEIFLVQTEFSPWKYSYHPRFEKIIESSIIQSENPFVPKIHQLANLSDLQGLFKRTLFFSTELNIEVGSEKRDYSTFDSFLIGPEGGFHKEEVGLLNSLENVEGIRLKTPIMKAEVAVVYAAGLLS